jgi:hypothetical protein
MRQDGGISSWLSSVADDDEIVVCPVVRGEILFGVTRLGAGRRHDELEAKARMLFSAMRCAPIPAAAGLLRQR